MFVQLDEVLCGFDGAPQAPRVMTANVVVVIVMRRGGRRDRAAG